VDRHVCNTAGIVDSGHGSTGKLCMLGARSAGGSRVRTVDDDNRLWINLSGKSSAGGKYLYGNGADRQAAARYYSAVIRGRPCRVAWFVELNDDDTAAVASTEDVADCTARADAQVRAVLQGVMAQQRSATVASGYVAALSPEVKANCWAIAESAGHDGWG
jgi:hypothetical protein